MTEPNIVWKSCGNYIVTLQKLPDSITNESRKSIAVSLTAKYRADKLKVIKIENKDYPEETLESIENTFHKSKTVIYIVGEIVSVDDFDTDLEKVCTTGIHYFKSKEVAFYWDRDTPENGKLIGWHENGNKKSEVTYVAGKRDGKWIDWYDNGKKLAERKYVSGKPDGKWISWHENGKKSAEKTYVAGKLDGISWHEDGHRRSEVTYVAGKLTCSNRNISRENWIYWQLMD